MEYPMMLAVSTIDTMRHVEMNSKSSLTTFPVGSCGPTVVLLVVQGLDLPHSDDMSFRTVVSWPCVSGAVACTWLGPAEGAGPELAVILLQAAHSVSATTKTTTDGTRPPDLFRGDMLESPL